MFCVMPYALTSFALAVQSYDPPRLENGNIQPVKIMTATAGAVMLDLKIDERGGVRSVRTVKDVAPFTDLTRDTVGSWTFEAAKDNRVRTEGRVLVIGLYRPPAMLFPMPEIPEVADSDDVIPFPVEFAVPPYPSNRVGAANVLVEAEVDDGGNVTSAVARTPETGFDDAATGTARQWRFRPAMRDGRAVRSRIYMIVSFRQPVN